MAADPYASSSSSQLMRMLLLLLLLVLVIVSTRCTQLVAGFQGREVLVGVAARRRRRSTFTDDDARRRRPAAHLRDGDVVGQAGTAVSPTNLAMSITSVDMLHHRAPTRIITNRLRRPRRRATFLFSSSYSDHQHHDHGGDVDAQDSLPLLTKDEIARYSRHLVLSDVGMKGQQMLKRSAVLVIGAGGLGSPALLYLAAAGIGHIGIVDADTVDSSNLQRQIIHGTSTIGMSKCASAQQRLMDLNPFVQVRVYEEEFTSMTAERIVGEGFSTTKPSYDVVIDGSDNFPTKYLINDVCAIHKLPWVYSAILAFEGQLSVFNYPPGIGPDYRDLLPVPPPPGDVPSCAEGGVLGVLPGTLGCLQAVECVKLLLHKTEGLCVGRVLVFDALQLKFSEIGLQRDPHREPITSLIDYQGFCAGPTSTASTTAASAAATGATTLPAGAVTEVLVNGSADVQPRRTMDEDADSSSSTAASTSLSSYHSIEPNECFAKLQSGWAPYVMDVRLTTEHDIVALPFTDRVVPHRHVSIRHVPQDGDVLLYCKGGVRGKKACQALVEQGVPPDRLYNLEGGILRWQKEIDPSMPRY